MKTSVGKGIRRKDVELILREDIQHRTPHVRIFREVTHRLLAHAQPKPEPIVWLDHLPKDRGLLLNRRQLIHPELAWVDVHAVRKMYRRCLLKNHADGNKPIRVYGLPPVPAILLGSAPSK